MAAARMAAARMAAIVDILAEALAHLLGEAPGEHTVGQPRRVAHRAQVDGVELLERVRPVLRHHRAGIQVVLGIPRKRFERQRQVEAARNLREHLARLERDFWPDVVSEHERDAVAGQCNSFPASTRTCGPGAALRLRTGRAMMVCVRELTRV